MMCEEADKSSLFIENKTGRAQHQSEREKASIRQKHTHTLTRIERKREANRDGAKDTQLK
jgi:hypothetical protein